MTDEPTLFDAVIPKPDEPDVCTDQGRILQAMRWAHEQRRMPEQPSRERLQDVPLRGSVTGVELQNICIDYRARISGLRKRGFLIQRKLLRYKDWRDRTRQIGCWRLTHYAQQLPDDYSPDTEAPF